jgi:hypothetical protein
MKAAQKRCIDSQPAHRLGAGQLVNELNSMNVRPRPAFER